MVAGYVQAGSYRGAASRQFPGKVPQRAELIGRQMNMIRERKIVEDLEQG